MTDASLIICADCGYSLHGIMPGHVCPECGGNRRTIPLRGEHRNLAVAALVGALVALLGAVATVLLLRTVGNVIPKGLATLLTFVCAIAAVAVACLSRRKVPVTHSPRRVLSTIALAIALTVAVPSGLLAILFLMFIAGGGLEHHP